jgi:hypothetical protein
MKQHEYFALISLVKEKMNWGYIIEAHTRGLPIGMFTKEQANSLEALREAGTLDHRINLKGKWREAIDDVSAGRPLHELPDDDKKRIVDVWYRSVFN